MKTNKQTIYSNAVSKIINRKTLTGQSFPQIKTPANIVKMEYFSRTYHVLDTWCSFYVWVGVTFFGLIWPLSDWVFVTFFGWVWVGVTFFWLGVGGYDLFGLGVSGCGWVWPFLGWVWVGVTFFWLGIKECDRFLTGCGLSVTFLDWV